MPSLEDLDAAWVAAARQRAAAGAWERDPGEVFAALADAPRAPRRAGTPVCPSCPGRPPLTPYRRAGSPSAPPIQCCDACHGAWVPDAALAAGLDLAELPVSAPGRDAGTPTEADTSAGRPCPSCARPMEPIPAGPAVLDRCPACRAAWFDTGELVRVFGIPPAPPGLPGGDAGPADAPAVAAWQLALDLAMSLLLPRGFRWLRGR
ncbi:zf-TFIIB domain-containing protein [Tepidiforma sp.]|jgi:hypothetical protein|uniref:zf-TFIIB domain-containing protein n=1 Tax=Tepidiforma sp. TaxID=2682230 RepID=UPI0021DCB59D|nr:zf-TFIIB domain-containing protein [Tepidiforma sp.]MCX7617889.1 zf-TFIIB domain-containing protein [Tepidiforma sp.]GIW18436.1 MAG: hypothetical protein KatS3mg064_1593 [Tepidiforma sp.]